MAAAFEERIQRLVDDKKIPNAIFYATDVSGSYAYHSAFGHASFEPDAKPLTRDHYMWAASCTKLLTSISIMQLVEQGRLGLDDAVYEVLPELADVKIITKAEPEPEYKTAQNKMTYRHLLTHTSGLGYDFVHPTLTAWRQTNQRAPGNPKPVPEHFRIPLLFEPGTAWLYGCGLDWAGLAVERLAGSTLAEYIDKNISRAVGAEPNSITFFPLRVPDAQLAVMAQRRENDTYEAGNQGSQDPSKSEFCYGGQGTWIRGDGYLKVLQSLLADDEKLLKRETAAELLRPQLDEATKKSLQDTVSGRPLFQRLVGRGSDPASLNHCLCGAVDGDGKPGWRRKGAVMWGGAPNLTWVLDREEGFCALQGAQLLPAGDAVYTDVAIDFEKSIKEQKAAAGLGS
ncbi:beta-lactamase/transpeptidase-like protein [Coniella lustricola]|uniref:Beta-lactamase/transpeptidase-like protein n=1 Tax=Coniella lustricola TaxID=2025994 RepID=A0A2T3ADQ2_9PEZI|nr:beta-lactamase/transpeptidase-like protein [Coniella lustricola]